MLGLDVWPSCVIPDYFDTQVAFYQEAQTTVNTFTGVMPTHRACFAPERLPDAPYEFMQESGEALGLDAPLALRAVVDWVLV